MTQARGRAGATAALAVGALVCFGSPARAAREFARVVQLGGALQDWVVDAHGRGLSGAEVAMPAGAAAAFWNPGALPLLETDFAAQTAVTRELGSIELRSVSAAGRQRALAFGAHLERFSYGGAVRTIFRPEGEGTSFKSTEELAILAVGVNVAEHLRRTADPRSRRLDWGMGLAYRLVRSDWVKEDDTAGDLELGTLLAYHIPAREGIATDPDRVRLQAGYTLRNLTNNHLSYSYGRLRLGRRDRGGMAVIVSAGPRTGAAPLVRGAVSYERQNLLVAAYEDEKPADRLGAELCIAGLVSARAGYAWDWRYRPRRDHRTWGLGLGLDPANPYTHRFGGRLDFARDEAGIASDVLDCTLSFWARL